MRHRRPRNRRGWKLRAKRPNRRPRNGARTQSVARPIARSLRAERKAAEEARAVMPQEQGRRRGGSFTSRERCQGQASRGRTPEGRCGGGPGGDLPAGAAHLRPAGCKGQRGNGSRRPEVVCQNRHLPADRGSRGCYPRKVHGGGAQADGDRAEFARAAARRAEPAVAARLLRGENRRLAHHDPGRARSLPCEQEGQDLGQRHHSSCR